MIASLDNCYYCDSPYCPYTCMQNISSSFQWILQCCVTWEGTHLKTRPVVNIRTIWHLKTKETDHKLYLWITTQAVFVNVHSHKHPAIMFFYLAGKTHGSWDVNAEEQHSVSSTQGLFIWTGHEETILVTIWGTLWYAGQTGQVTGLTEVTHFNLQLSISREHYLKYYKHHQQSTHRDKHFTNQFEVWIN